MHESQSLHSQTVAAVVGVVRTRNDGAGDSGDVTVKPNTVTTAPEKGTSNVETANVSESETATGSGTAVFVMM